MNHYYSTNSGSLFYESSFKYIVMKIIYLALILLTSTCASSGNKDNNIKEALENGKDIFIENVSFEDDIHITDYLKANKISPSVSQVVVESSITFSNCTFEGDVTAFKKNEDGSTVITLFKGSVSFISCTFKQKFNLRSCSILGRANFFKSYFEGEVSFEELSFFQNASFSDCVFTEDARFQNAFFMQKANFMNAGFDKTAYFQAVTFNAEAQFSVARFIGYADFSLISCRQNLFMNYAEFEDKSIFNNSYFYGRSDFLKVKFKYCEFKKCYFSGAIRFNDSAATESISFENTTFWPEEPDLSMFEK